MTFVQRLIELPAAAPGIRDTATPSVEAIDLAADEESVSVLFVNTHEDLPGSVLATLSGPDAASFQLTPASLAPGFLGEVSVLGPGQTSTRVVLDAKDVWPNARVTNNDLSIETRDNAGWFLARATRGLSSGKWYWEVVCDATITMIGLGRRLCVGNDQPGGAAGFGVAYYSGNGQKYRLATGAAYGNTYTAADVIGVAYDADLGAVWFSKNGTWQNSATGAEIAAGTTTNAAFADLDGEQFPMVAVQSPSGAGVLAKATCRFDADDFTGTAPAGFQALTEDLTHSLTVTRIGGASGATLTASLDIHSSEGRVSIPITAVVPATMEAVYQTRGAQHILAFDAADAFGDTGSNPTADWTTAGSAARAAATVPSCKGLLTLPGTTSHLLSPSLPNDMGFNADRTWVLVLEHNNTDTTDVFLLRDDQSQATGFGDVLTIHISPTSGEPFRVRRRDGLDVPLTDIDSSHRNTPFYVAIRYNAATRTFRVLSKLDGGTQHEISDVLTAVGLTSLNEVIRLGGIDANDPTAVCKYHFFAVINRQLTDDEILADLALLGF